MSNKAETTISRANLELRTRLLQHFPNDLDLEVVKFFNSAPALLIQEMLRAKFGVIPGLEKNNSLALWTKEFWVLDAGSMFEPSMHVFSSFGQHGLSAEFRELLERAPAETEVPRRVAREDRLTASCEDDDVIKTLGADDAYVGLVDLFDWMRLRYRVSIASDSNVFYYRLPGTDETYRIMEHAVHRMITCKRLTRGSRVEGGASVWSLHRY